MSSSTKSHILLLGGTGKTGRLLLADLLSKQYTVTALARKPESLDSTSQDKLNVIKGDPTSRESMMDLLSEALRTAGSRSIIVISTLGQTRASGNPWSATTSPAMFMTSAIQALLNAIKQLTGQDTMRIEKLVFMSMFGAGESFNNLHFLIKPIMNHSNMLQTVEDHNGVNAVIRGQNDVKWTMVKPAMLKEGPAMLVKIRDEAGKGEGWLPSSITIGTVVEFIVKCLTSDEYVNKAPVITN